MITSVSQDISTLTTIPKFQIDNLFDKITYVICHAVEENLQSKEPLSEIDIGIGTLYIKTEEDSIKYKFIPSSKLEQGVKNTVSTGESPLVFKVEQILKDRITNAYKDLF